MSYTVRPYRIEDDIYWDDFCFGAYQGTFLHTRKFLSYHKERFADCSLVVEEEGRWVGIFPAAIHPVHQNIVVSHPGITYGGLLHRGDLRGENMVVALDDIVAFYKKAGLEKLIYKCVPEFYHRVPAKDDVYALFRLGAQRVRCDLSSTIDIGNRQPLKERRRRGQKKAAKAGVIIRHGSAYLEPLWQVLSDNLKRKHQATPVHTYEEILLLTERFPENIKCIVGELDGFVVCGIVVFSTPTVDHAQYIASSEIGYQFSALDAVFAFAINCAEEQGKRWFDFGISTERSGSYLNQGLYGFKSEFGGGGTVHEFYELEI